MIVKKIFSVLIILLFGISVYSQSWRLHINGNETYFIGNKKVSYYPILWYSTQEGRGILIGGFGLGISYSKAINEKIDFRYQINLHRSRFYDSPVMFTDIQGNSIGATLGINTSYNISGFVLPQLNITKSKKWKVGIGLGFRSVVFSESKYGHQFFEGKLKDLTLKNRSISPFIVTLPLEINRTSGKWFFALRAESSINSSSLLEVRKSERAIIVFGEIAYKL